MTVRGSVTRHTPGDSTETGAGASSPRHRFLFLRCRAWKTDGRMPTVRGDRRSSKSRCGHHPRGIV